MIRLDGKKAWITGGSRGIGRASAVMLAQAGCDVVINYKKNRNEAEKVKQMVEKEGRECLIYRVDMSRKDQVETLVKEVVERWGKLDILVNNAGIWTYGEIGNMDEDVWKETMSINLDGVFYTCNAVVPYMKERKSGRIINVSSTAGVRGEAYHSHYAATKGAVISFTKSLGAELASYNIGVNCVAPGWVDTEMCAEVFRDPEYRKKIEQSIPLNRIPPPQDIAGPIVFLASNLARHITGEIINVNGGSVLCG
ncbi:SDR family oxidoreductase [bacterium]|nr:SDR family oxidoreductase [bacterium]